MVFLVIGLTCMKPYFYAQTSDAAIAQQGIQYLSVCCIFSLGLFTQTMGEKLLAATGRTYLSMISQLVGAVVNIILDPISSLATAVRPSVVPPAQLWQRSSASSAAQA